MPTNERTDRDHVTKHVTFRYICKQAAAGLEPCSFCREVLCGEVLPKSFCWLKADRAGYVQLGSWAGHFAAVFPPAEVLYRICVRACLALVFGSEF